MSASGWLNPTTVLMELEPRTLRVCHAGVMREWTLERSGDGALSPASRQRLLAELPPFLPRRPWQSHLDACCALTGAGVTLRRWKLPRTAPEELGRLIRLQVESEFPLPPEELAWGWCRLGEAANTQEILVAAVKRDVVEEYARLFAECGLAVSFTPAALARQALCPGGSPAGSVVTIGREQSEWLASDALGPVRLRLIPWGEANLLRALEAALGTGREAAVQALERFVAGETLPGWDRIGEALVGDLAGLMPAGAIGGRLWLAGSPGVLAVLPVACARHWGGSVACEVLWGSTASGLSSALEGLRRLAHAQSRVDAPLLRLQVEETAPTPVLAESSPRRWAIVAGALLLAWLALPYAEAFWFRPPLARRVAAVKAKRDQLALIDREADFLRNLRLNQAPALETLLVLGKTAPPGSRIDAFNLNRKGELSLRLSVRQPQEATDFRSKLVDSGFFTSVVLEEQTPSPDRQKIQLRVSAQVKPPGAREHLKILAPENAPGTNTARPGGAPGQPSGLPAGALPLPPGGGPPPMPMPAPGPGPGPGLRG